MVTHNKKRNPLMYSAIALAMATGGEVKAQTTTTPAAPQNIAGSIVLNQSSQTGNGTAIFANGSAVDMSALTQNGEANGYGGLVDLSFVSTPASDISFGGVFSANNSQLLSGNVLALSLNGSVVSQAAMGNYSTADGVGAVSQIIASVGDFTRPSVSGVATFMNTTLKAGDVTTIDYTGSLAADAGIGNGLKINPYGGYGSYVVNVGAASTPTGGYNAGSIFGTNTIFGASNLTAFAGYKSDLLSSVAGPTAVNQGVGQVVKVTYGATPN